MRIAQVAPLSESVPPLLYGGTERVVYYLTQELMRMGHDVTLFASGDSRTAARLVPGCPKALRLDEAVYDPYAYAMLQLGRVFDHADEFDVIHSHLDYFTFPFTRLVRTPTLVTPHGRLDLFDIAPIFREYTEVNLVSVSNNQRNPLPFANWLGTVYHGIDLGDYRFGAGDGNYLAFLGRISPEKGVDLAIRVAQHVGMPLKIAAKVDAADKAYYDSVIAPLLETDNVEFVGEVDQAAKSEFLRNAYALLFPIRWPEPFGLVMIEAMACGTPVIALTMGAAPEVIASGRTGFVCDSYEAMVQAVCRVHEIDRRECRHHVETNFSARVMALGYEDIYRRLILTADRAARERYGKAA
ncbi:MAG: glycosyltransferase family 4 protein [Chloroflexota bacterium]|nr:MAG: glycosyltransferase family 4 protein [Chloroflexota bacterium]